MVMTASTRSLLLSWQGGSWVAYPPTVRPPMHTTAMAVSWLGARPDAGEIIPGGMSSASPLDTAPAAEDGGPCLAPMPPSGGLRAGHAAYV